MASQHVHGAECIKQYCAGETASIATGILMTALLHAGLTTRTLTPNPMGFLLTLLGCSTNKRAAMIVVAGCSAEGANMSDIGRKNFGEISNCFD